MMFDIILGESWLREHRVVLDYADNRLWQKGLDGKLLPMSFEKPTSTAETSGFPVALPKWLSTWHSTTATVAAEPAAEMQSPPQERYFPMQSSHVLSGSRTRRLERRHAPKLAQHRYLQAVLDFAKELPEDGELELSDIPGIATAERTAFSFVEDEVRVHLAHLPAVQIDEVVERLRVFDGDVFETRKQPRPPPEREFDVPIVEKPGMEPPARRPYPVAPHHQPELDRQIKALLDAGIIRRSFSPYSAPVLFTPKKDGTMRMVVDYRQLNSQTIRDRFPTPTAGDLIAKTRGAKLFSKIDLQSGFHQLRMREADMHKTAFATPSGLYEFVSAPFGLTSVPGAFQRFMQFGLALEVKCCASNHISVSSQGRQILTSAKTLSTVGKTGTCYGYLSSKVE